MIKLKVYPVAWSSNKVLKYRAHAEYFLAKNRKRILTIYGNPQSSEQLALDSLEIECIKWRDAANETLHELINNKEQDGI